MGDARACVLSRAMEMASVVGLPLKVRPGGSTRGQGETQRTVRCRAAVAHKNTQWTGFSRASSIGGDTQVSLPATSHVPRQRRVHIRKHTKRFNAASVPLSESDGDANDASADSSDGNSTQKNASEKKSNVLRLLGIKNGILGVEQSRVEMVMHQALPVMGGMASQNVLNLADSVMVGRLGTACVASVGIASTLNFQCQAALQGISSGVQAMSARRIGEGRPEFAAVPLNAALVACVCLGVPMAVAAFIAAPSIVPRLTSDPAVIAAAVPYLKARLLAVPAVGVNFAFRGFWNAVQQPQIYMNTLLVMHIVNVSLSLLLIFGASFSLPLIGNITIPSLGVVGAGIGTTVSVWVGTALYLKMGFQRAKEMGFARKKPSAEDLKTLLGQAAPTSITNLLFATGMTVLYWIVGKLGTAETAAVNVLINLMLTLVLPCMGMGLAAGALSGRALGRGDVEDAAQWPWDVAKLTAAMMFGIGMIAVVIPEKLLSYFLTNQEAIAKATLPLRFTGITVAFDALSVTMQNALLGVGDAKKVAAISIGTQWVLFLPVAYLGVTYFPGFNLNYLWGLYVAQRVLQGFLYANIWKKGGWKDIKV